MQHSESKTITWYCGTHILQYFWQLQILIHGQCSQITLFRMRPCYQGDFQLKNGQNCSRFTLSQKSESHQRSCPPLHNSNDGAIYRKWANNLGAKLPNLKTNFAGIWKAPQHGSCNPASQLPCVVFSHHLTIYFLLKPLQLWMTNHLQEAAVIKCPTAFNQLCSGYVSYPTITLQTETWAESQ